MRDEQHRRNSQMDGSSPTGGVIWALHSQWQASWAIHAPATGALTSICPKQSGHEQYMPKQETRHKAVATLHDTCLKQVLSATSQAAPWSPDSDRVTRYSDEHSYKGISTSATPCGSRDSAGDLRYRLGPQQTHEHGGRPCALHDAQGNGMTTTAKRASAQKVARWLSAAADAPHPHSQTIM